MINQTKMLIGHVSAQLESDMAVEIFMQCRGAAVIDTTRERETTSVLLPLRLGRWINSLRLVKHKSTRVQAVKGERCATRALVVTYIREIAGRNRRFEKGTAGSGPKSFVEALSSNRYGLCRDFSSAHAKLSFPIDAYFPHIFHHRPGRPEPHTRVLTGTVSWKEPVVLRNARSLRKAAQTLTHTSEASAA